MNESLMSDGNAHQVPHLETLGEPWPRWRLGGIAVTDPIRFPLNISAQLELARISFRPSPISQLFEARTSVFDR